MGDLSYTVDLVRVLILRCKIFKLDGTHGFSHGLDIYLMVLCGGCLFDVYFLSSILFDPPVDNLWDLEVDTIVVPELAELMKLAASYSSWVSGFYLFSFVTWNCLALWNARPSMFFCPPLINNYGILIVITIWLHEAAYFVTLGITMLFRFHWFKLYIWWVTLRSLDFEFIWFKS